MSKSSSAARHVFVLGMNVAIVTLIFIASQAKSAELSRSSDSPAITDSAAPLQWELQVFNGGHVRGAVHPAVAQTAHGDAAPKFAAARIIYRASAQDNDSRETLGFAASGSSIVVGDFDGNGMSETAIFAQGRWYIDLNGNGRWDEGDLAAALGTPGSRPVVGDWDGDGKTDLGFCSALAVHDAERIRAESGLPDVANAEHGARQSRLVSLAADGAHDDHAFSWATGGCLPIVGDFNGDGVSTIGSYCAGVWRIDMNGDGRFTSDDREFMFGLPGDQAFVGDFDGDGIDEIALYRGGTWIIDADNDHAPSAGDVSITWGDAGQEPIVGDFDGDGLDDLAAIANQ